MEAARVVNSLQLVVPCYNERTRLAVDQIGVLTADKRVSLVLVDDGSSDSTATVLASFGDFKRDSLNVTVFGRNQPNSQKIYDRVAWK